MNISIIIPTFKRRKSLERLLKSIAKQEYPKSDFEVIVVDDQSGEDLNDLVSLFKEKMHVRWVVSNVKGRPGARNTGVREAVGYIIIFLDDDMEIEDGFIEEHKKLHAGNRCVVSGCIKAAGNYKGLWNTIIDSRFDLRDDKIDRIKQPSFTTVFTGNMSILKQTFMEMNGFDEVTFSYYGGEDFDFGIRCIEKGLPIYYCGNAVAVHHEKQFTMKSFLNYNRWAAYGMAALIKKHKDRALADPAMVGFPCDIPNIYYVQQNPIKGTVKRILQIKVFVETGFYFALFFWSIGIKELAVTIALFSRKLLYEKYLQKAIYETIIFKN